MARVHKKTTPRVHGDTAARAARPSRGCTRADPPRPGPAAPHESEAALRHVRPLLILAAALACGGLAACNTADDVRSGVGDIGTSLRDSFGRNTDSNGTQRRPDVNGLYTRPSLPTIVNR